MSINRHNYEEFFILYLDNELSAAQRQEVMLFVQQNPDLADELALLQQSILVPDESLRFEDKEILLRSTAGFTIHLNNYEQWLLLYTDGELTAGQVTVMEDFAASHPAVQRELEILQRTKLQPDETVVFTDKASLYRGKEMARRVVVMRWTRIAVAAVLLFAISTTAIFFFNQPVPAGSIASPNDETGLAKNAVIAITKETKPDYAIKTDANPAADRKTTPENAVKVQDKTTLAHVKKANEDAVEEKNVLIAQAENNDPGYIADGSINISNRVKVPPPSLIKENNPEVDVTSDPPQPFIQAVNRTQPMDEIVYESEKKNKLRGFFRKVTRTFEKTTNIKATDDDNRLLVAGFAVRL